MKKVLSFLSLIFVFFLCSTILPQNQETRKYGDSGNQFTEEVSMVIGNIGITSLGDYDGDGDLDIGVASSIYRNNGDKTFSEQTSISLADVVNGIVDWGDYDNDGDLDIFLNGNARTGNYVELAKIYKNNGNNTFTEQTSIQLPGVVAQQSSWVDYDNDGYLDLSLNSKIYKNNGNNTFTEKVVFNHGGASTWGDFDNDGDMDVIFIGAPSTIYVNNGDGSFTEKTSTPFPNLNGQYSVAGDYDNDGDLDILLAGYIEGAGHLTKVYRNNGDFNFTDQTGYSIMGVRGQRTLAWGDYDNDGDLDILVHGATGRTDPQYITRIYKNDGNDTFIYQDQISLPAGINTNVDWGDYDNDNDLDLIFTFWEDNVQKLKIFSNNIQTPNTKPSAPSNLVSTVYKSAVTLSWDKSTDNETPQNGLKYNIVVGTNTNGVDVVSPMSIRNTGFREVINIGNTNLNNMWTVKNLQPGKYYWSVQAIDNNFAGSPFAEEQTFSVPFNINYKVTLPSCDDPDSSVEVVSGQIKEGESFIIPEYELPIEYQEYQKYYNALAGSEIGIPVGSLNENIEFNINFEGICENGLLDNPSTQDIIELLFLSVNIIGEDSGPHNLLEYYYFENDNEAYIKIPIANLDTLKEFLEFDVNSLIPFFINNGLKPDFKGIRKEIDNEYFTIYTKHFSKLNLGFFTSPTGIDSELNELPTEFSLSQNYPNPFNPSTTIKYQISAVKNLHAASQHVQLKVYDVLGKEVATLVNKAQNPGYYKVNFDANNLTSGIYYYQLKVGSFVETKKMIILK